MSVSNHKSPSKFGVNLGSTMNVGLRPILALGFVLCSSVYGISQANQQDSESEAFELVTAEISKEQSNDSNISANLSKAKENVGTVVSHAQQSLKAAESYLQNVFRFAEHSLVQTNVIDSRAVSKTENFLKLNSGVTATEGTFFSESLMSDLRQKLESVKILRKNLLYHSLALTGAATLYFKVTVDVAKTTPKAMIELSKVYGAGEALDRLVDDNISNPNYIPKGFADAIQFKISKFFQRASKNSLVGKSVVSGLKRLDIFAKGVKQSSATAMGALTKNVGVLYVLSGLGVSYFGYTQYSDIQAELKEISELEFQMEQTLAQFENVQLMKVMQ